LKIEISINSTKTVYQNMRIVGRYPNIPRIEGQPLAGSSFFASKHGEISRHRLSDTGQVRPNTRNDSNSVGPAELFVWWQTNCLSLVDCAVPKLCQTMHSPLLPSSQSAIMECDPFTGSALVGSTAGSCGSSILDI